MEICLNELEQQLVSAIDRQTVCYSKAIQLIQQLMLAMQHGEPWEPHAAELASCIQEATQIGNSCKELRAQWMQINRKPGTALANSLDKAAGVLKELIQQIQTVEKLVHDKISQTVPRLEHEARLRSMRQAYRFATKG